MSYLVVGLACLVAGIFGGFWIEKNNVEKVRAAQAVLEATLAEVKAYLAKIDKKG
jgi:uncharacterized protein YneF (UPF0154 family)